MSDSEREHQARVRASERMIAREDEVLREFLGENSPEVKRIQDFKEYDGRSINRIVKSARESATNGEKLIEITVEALNLMRRFGSMRVVSHSDGDVIILNDIGSIQWDPDNKEWYSVIR